MMTKKRYFFWNIVFVIVALSTVASAQNQPPEGFKESDLIKVLQSDASKGDKAITCKRLAIYGTAESVPVVAPLLSDKELSSWARITLEAIPGPAADAALRDAAVDLEGRLLVGVINSIGVRRDVKAVEILAKKLNDADVNVATAAAVALGHIGGQKAAKALTESLTDAQGEVRSASAEGCIMCAEQFMAQNETAEAVKLYDTVRQAKVSDQKHLEAIRGAILARGSSGIPLLIEQLHSADKKRLGIGLRTARELGGRAVTEVLADELPRLSAERRPLLLLALADRKDSAVLATVLEAAQSSQKDLRITAITILIRLGDVSCVPVLLEAATEGDAQLEKAAVETLVRLSGKDIDADLLARLGKSRGKLRRVLIELAGQRQIGGALPAVVSSLEDTDADIRIAAVETVAIIGQDQQTADLVQMLLETSNSGERDVIRKALRAVCGRGGTRCIEHLRPLTQSSDNELQIMGLRALAIIGGPDALASVETAIAGGNAPVQDEAVRILSTWPNNWPEDSEAGQALLKLATSSEKVPHQVLGLRGCLQYIRGNKNLGNEQKVAKVKQLLPHIKRPEEKHQAIAILEQSPSVNTLDLLTTLAEDPATIEESYSAMVKIASQDVEGVSKDRRRQVLQTVTENSKNDETKQRADKALSGIK
ncbi:MAG: HEAT repeat domain-containing protein [Sedimentisphaerales bacterium]|nr:HEAT repeat domain-containing protein [Sedimentisphaerales bacterium]